MLILSTIEMCEELLKRVMDLFVVRHAFCYLDLQD